MLARNRILRSILIAFVGASVVFLVQPSVSAHPLDQLTQHLVVQLQSTEVDITAAVGGGLLANELVLSQLDNNGDGEISPAEQSAWLELWSSTLTVTLDQEHIPISPNSIHLSVPPIDDFHLGVTPLLLTFAVPLLTEGNSASHLLAIRNDYLINRTTYRINVESGTGTEIVDQSWPSSSMRVAFTAVPSVAAGDNETAAEAARQWSGNDVLAKARRVLEHEKTPAFMIALLGIFAFMGALHAIQPGHGKTLVAAYLVATGGTPRDALALAGIVTFTHTISVFVLGLATLGASQLLLPSKVIPVMGAISGLLVAIMGIAMLRSALRRIRNFSNSGAVEHVHQGEHHHHFHGHMTDEEHERLHLEETLRVRQGVSKRSLITLGVSGGLAPCPDALAILLLAIGMNQAGLGMVAIVAFSAGLAIVLVAFGLMVAMMGPAWNRAKRSASGLSTRRSQAFGRFTTFAPMGSACIVLLLGIAMAWRSIALG